jgi:hypothetical protein
MFCPDEREKCIFNMSTYIQIYNTRADTVCAAIVLLDRFYNSVAVHEQMHSRQYEDIHNEFLMAKRRLRLDCSLLSCICMMTAYKTREVYQLDVRRFTNDDGEKYEKSMIRDGEITFLQSIDFTTHVISGD